MHTAWLASLVLGTTPCWAALGEAPDARGAPPAPAGPADASWSQVQRQLPSGTTVHEFVDARGAVFAVAWSGPFLPDLRALLGRHFETFGRQVRQDGLRSPVVVRRDDVVIVSAGRLGAFEGRAWLPGRLPAQFDPGMLP